MMSLDFITELYIPIVLAACLVVGFILKKWCPADNKWIPTVLVILGAVLGCVASAEVSLESIVAGAVTGLASTGLHQVFKQLLGLGAGEPETKSYDKIAVETRLQADMDAAEKEDAEAAQAQVKKVE